MELLKKEENEVFAIIIGPDESEGRFKEYINQTLLNEGVDYNYLGSVLNVSKYMRDFDVLLVPTHREGFGLVAAEANALEVPFIGYDIVGIKDSVSNNETGTLVKFKDIFALKEAVKLYKNNYELKNRHGIRGRERVRRLFDRVSLWEALLESYNEILVRK